MPNVRASTRTRSELGKWRELMRWLPLPIALPPLALVALMTLLATGALWALRRARV